MDGGGRLSLRHRRLDFANQLVGFFLRHLSAAYHILYEIACTLDHESAEPGCGVDDILHCSCHFAAGFETDLVSFGSHFGDSVLYVGSAMPGATPRWNRRGYWRCWGSGCGSWLGRFLCLSHSHSYMVCGRRTSDGRDAFANSGRPWAAMGGSGAKYMIFRN